MSPHRYCDRCGTRLAHDQRGTRCSPCSKSVVVLRPEPQPAEFWEQPDVREALSSRHFGRVLRAYRRALGSSVTQTTLGTWLGLTQARISQMERAKEPPSDLRKLQQWAKVLHIPAAVLWFEVEQKSDEYGSGETAVNLGDVDRRDVLKLAGAATVLGASVLQDAPWQRLADALDGRRAADGTTVRMIESRTATFFRTEETSPARQLVQSLMQHRAELAAIIDTTANESLRRRLVTAIGETEALAGWTLFDLGRHRDALRLYQSALENAKEAGDGPLAACVLTYWSYLVSNQGNTAEAINKLNDAAERVRGSAPATQAWVLGRLAEEYAQGGDTRALRALDRAMSVFDYASPETERPWTAFFTPSRLGSLAVSAYGRLEHRETDDAAASLLGSLSPTENKVRALVLADLAASAARSGDIDRVDDLSKQSAPLAVRTEASLALDRLWEVVELLPAQGRGSGAKTRERLTESLLQKT